MDGVNPDGTVKVSELVSAPVLFVLPVVSNVPVATVRPFNTYGPRQSARAVIPTIVSQALYEKEIFLGSLSPVRPAGRHSPIPSM